MDNEKLLPTGEPGIEVDALPILRSPAPPVKPTPEPITPPALPGMPTQQQQQWGVVISIVIIVLMIIIGAFYAWGQRIAQNEALTAPTTAK